MKNPERPAACLRAGPEASPPALTRQRQAIAESARRRGSPAPAICACERTGPAAAGAPALAMLSAAIGGGRHDAVLMISPCAIGGLHPCLMSLLLSCARHGVAAGAALTPLAMPSPPGAFRDRAAGGASRAARSPGTCVAGKPG